MDEHHPLEDMYRLAEAAERLEALRLRILGRLDAICPRVTWQVHLPRFVDEPFLEITGQVWLFGQEYAVRHAEPPEMFTRRQDLEGYIEYLAHVMVEGLVVRAFFSDAGR